MHTHSLRSDGTLTPSELVQRAHAAGVRVLALTDHDVTDGIAEAQTAADRLGLILIVGVEIRYVAEPDAAYRWPQHQPRPD